MWLKLTILSAILFLRLAYSNASLGKNVLVIDGVGLPSHQVWMHRLTYAIANHGYNVTALSCKVHETKSENLHSYHLEKIYPQIETMDVNLIEMGEMAIWTKFILFNIFASFINQPAITSRGLQEIMNFPEDFHFDLIVFDYLSPLTLLVLADRFPHASLIGASPYPAIDYTNVVTKAPAFSSWVPNIYIDAVDGFWSRTNSFLTYLGNDFVLRYINIPVAQREVNRHFKTHRSIEDLYFSLKIQLVNYHPVLDFVQPIMPGVIPVGGLQVTNKKPLPERLEKIFEIPSKAVILFSLGSAVKSEQLGEGRLKEIIGALAEIPDYSFIWKIDLTGLNVKIPRNVFVENWLPQNDILAHNKTVLFISHAGALSTQESTWHGVPMLALPIAIDHFPVSESL